MQNSADAEEFLRHISGSVEAFVPSGRYFGWIEILCTHTHNFIIVAFRWHVRLSATRVAEKYGYGENVGAYRKQ